MTTIESILWVIIGTIIGFTAVQVFFLEKKRKKELQNLKDDIDALRKKFNSHFTKTNCTAHAESIRLVKDAIINQGVALGKTNDDIKAICEHLNIELKHEKHSRFTHK